MLSSCRVLPTRVGGRPGRARLPPSRFYPRLVVHEIGCRTLYTMCFRVQTPGLGMAGAGPASTKWLLPIGATALHCTAMHCAAGVSCARQEPSCAMLSFTGSYKSSRSREALRHPLGPPLAREWRAVLSSRRIIPARLAVDSEHDVFRVSESAL